MKARSISASLALALGLSVSAISLPATASGNVTGQVNNLKAHLDDYTSEVQQLVNDYDAIVADYVRGGSKQADTEALLEHWEEVDFHAAIETQYIPMYATIWQGIYGVKNAIEKDQGEDAVKEQQQMLNQALWQALGAVKLASHYQQKGMLEDVQTSAKEPTSAPQVIDDIEKRLNKVVAEYAETEIEEATTLLHDTYMQRFEGIEGALIEQDAELVEELEKDFNVTLPQALEKNVGVDKVRDIVNDMQSKLARAKSLLEQAEQNRKDVF